MDTQDMQQNKKNRTLILTAGVMLIIGLLIGSFFGAPSASANGFTDFLGRLFPFMKSGAPAGTVGSAANATNTVPLYQPTNSYEQAVVDAVKAASPAVVSITVSENVPVIEQCPYNPFGDLGPQFQQFFGGQVPNLTQPCNTGKTQLQAVGGGSGFIISPDGLILTNKHVVSNPNASYSVLTNDGKTYVAKVLARDPNQDLAVLKINATNLPTVKLGDSNSLELGQTAIAIGNALGQFSNTVSVGVVSGLSRTVTAASPDTGAQETITGVIQTDAAINPGNSGGPLLNLQGQVIGIDTAIASGAQNIGFAIPIDDAKHDISSVETTGKIQSPYLGVRYLPVTPALATQQNLPVSAGALVRGDSSGPAVIPGSPAAKAGIQAEDIITQVNGQAIDATHDLASIIDQFGVGQTITLTVNRGGKTIALSVTLAARPAGS